MKTIHDYVPPDAASLRRLQERLGYSDAQMAELAGLDAAVPWSSYVGGPRPRALGQQRLLGIAARLTLVSQPGHLFSGHRDPQKVEESLYQPHDHRHHPLHQCAVGAGYGV